MSLDRFIHVTVLAAKPQTEKDAAATVKSALGKCAVAEVQASLEAVSRELESLSSSGRPADPAAFPATDIPREYKAGGGDRVRFAPEEERYGEGGMERDSAGMFIKGVDKTPAQDTYAVSTPRTMAAEATAMHMAYEGHGWGAVGVQGRDGEEKRDKKSKEKKKRPAQDPLEDEKPAKKGAEDNEPKEAEKDKKKKKKDSKKEKKTGKEIVISVSE